MSDGKKSKKKRARKTPVAGSPKKRPSEPVIERPSEPAIGAAGDVDRPSEPAIDAAGERLSEPAIETTKFERALSPGVETTKFERASAAPVAAPAAGSVAAPAPGSESAPAAAPGSVAAPESAAAPGSVSAPVVAPDAVPLGRQPASQSGRSRPATMPPPLPVGKPAASKSDPAAKPDPAAKSDPAAKPAAGAPAGRPGRYRPPTMPPPPPAEALRPREPQVSLVDRLLGRLLRRKPEPPAPILPAAWTTPAPAPTVKSPASSDTTLSPQDIIDEAESSADRTSTTSGSLVEKLSSQSGTQTSPEPSASSSETALSTQDILLEDVRAALEAAGRADAVAPAEAQPDKPGTTTTADKPAAATPAEKPVAVAATSADKPVAAKPVVAPPAVAEPGAAPVVATPAVATTAVAAEPADKPADKPVAAKPVVATPAVAAPLVADPAVATPAAATPSSKPVAPAVATPAVATPAVATPAVATPAVATPAVAAPAVAAPAVATSVDKPVPAERAAVSPVAAPPAGKPAVDTSADQTVIAAPSVAAPVAAAPVAAALADMPVAAAPAAAAPAAAEPAVAEPVAETAAAAEAPAEPPLPVAPIISWTDQSSRQKPSTTPPLETSGERTKAPTSPPEGERTRSATSPPEGARTRSATSPPEGERTPEARTKSPTAPPDGATPTAPPEAVSRAERTKAPSAPPADEPAPFYPRAETVRLPDNLSLSPEWPLDTSEAEGAVIPAPPPESVPSSMMPDPKAAALEAARIVGEIVGDIESAGGAAIVAAAAAGAAIEAARARNRAVAEGEVVPTSSTEAGPIGDASGNDPVVTVRMQRDRILRALAEDVAAQAEKQANQESAQASEAASERSAQPGRAATQPGVRSSSQVIARPAGVEQSADATQEEGDDELDPVQIASAAIQRFRQRAKTDLAELKGHYHRHDVFVLMFALVIIVIAGRVHRGMVTPPTTKFSKNGLVFEHSQAWLGAEPVPTPAPRIAHELAGQPVKSSNVYHVEFTSTLGTDAKIEVLIDKKPTWSNIVTGLELDRRTRWGELYTLDDSSVRSIAEHDWLRTAYRYAHVAHKGDVPRVDSAVEYATIDREQIYVVTLFGTEKEIERLEDVVAPSLRVPTRTGLPLVPQTRMLSQRTYPNAVARAFDSTVMVVVADLVDGRLRPRGGGSGVVVGSDGSILTNYHVIHDKNGRLHDVFVIGRFSKPDHAPQLWCAGRPSRSKLQRDLDLALIKCDIDLDGRTWNPTSGSIWATLPEARSVDVKMGQRLWVLGYPDVGGGGLTLSEGEVDGWTGTNNTAGKDFIKTNASITHGNSGGPVVDDQGRLVGVASAFRTRVTIGGDVTESKETGLVRPLSTASCLLAIAAVGWTPREGHSDCELQPSAVEAPADGVRISTKIVDAANDAAVVDALVMILRPGVSASAVDVNRLDDQVLSWGRSNTQGDVQLKQPVPVPGTYTVMVVARGYEPLIGENELRLDAKTPPNFDPWGKIWLRSR